MAQQPTGGHRRARHIHNDKGVSCALVLTLVNFATHLSVKNTLYPKLFAYFYIRYPFFVLTLPNRSLGFLRVVRQREFLMTDIGSTDIVRG